MSIRPRPRVQVFTATLLSAASSQVRALADDIPTIEPSRRIDAGDLLGFPSLDFSPDGATLYFAETASSINLWSAGVALWPEILGAVAALCAILAVWVILRVRRRPQTVGAPHCRGCNYNVVAQAPDAVKRGADRRPPPPGTLCPECGADLARRPPRRGRSALRRAAPVVAPALLVALVYTSFLIVGLPRGGRAAGWFGLWVPRVDRLAQEKQWKWLLGRSEYVVRIRSVSVSGADEPRTIATVKGYAVPNGLRVAPDGRHLVLVTIEGQVLWISRDGSRVASMTLSSANPMPKHDNLVGFLGEDRDPWVCLADTDRASQVSRLIRWNPASGQRAVMVEEPAWLKRMPTGEVPLGRRYAVAGSPAELSALRPLTISAPGFMQSSEADRYEVVVRTADGQERNRFEIAEMYAGMSGLMLRQESGWLFLSNLASGIVGYDLATGERLGEFRSALTDPSDGNAAISADGRRLFLSLVNSRILVRDIDRKRTIARLTYPAGFISPDIFASRDGRRVAIVPTRNSGTRAAPKYERSLFIYDLGQTEAGPPPAAAPGRSP